MSELGTVPPQALELEEAVIGSILLERDAQYRAMEILKTPEVFYSEVHKTIYQSIMDLNAESQPVDIRTITNQLRKSGKLEQIGGAFQLAEITSKISSAANIEAHCAMILEKFFLREIIKNGSENIGSAYKEEADAFEILDIQYKNLNELAEFLDRGTQRNMQEILLENISDTEKAMASPDSLTGIDTGLHKLNQITGGLQKQDLFILAARPGMGKTALALSIANNITKQGKVCAFFSLEMSDKKLVMRLQSMESEIAFENIQRGKITSYDLKLLVDRSSRIKDELIIIDKPGISILEVKTKLNRMRREKGLDVVMIDYLQLMTGDRNSQNREQEISYISRNLKGIAKEFDVPVLALAQLSRAVETRGGNKKPMLSDLRESGAIEQDADIVSFLWRPEYYGIKEDENGNSTQGYAELIISKHRNGALDDIPLRFIHKFTKFTDYQETAAGDTDNSDVPF